MKFGAKYQEALQREEYPKEWLDSAIPYKKLKKCIKRVQQELQSLGLDHDTLDKLWQHVGSTVNDNSNINDVDRVIDYSFSTDPKVKFIPKLTVAIDPRDGTPMDAWLSPETKRVLRKVGRRESNVDSNGVDGSENAIPIQKLHQDVGSGESSAAGSEAVSLEGQQGIETIEIPLSSDSEFFQILRKELKSLDALQAREQQDIETNITGLGEDLRALKTANKKRSREEIESWREVFRLYNDAEIFVSSHEQDAGARDATHAEKQLQLFSKSLMAQQKNGLKMSKDAMAALERFMLINVNLLRLLKFQEINRLALSKIMKKFDKRTALHAQTNMLRRYREQPFLSRNLARATCFTISNQLLKIIPQLDDYLCPICFTISWKPVRLRCQHVFCIRCLIVLQRGDKDECPLCREKVVLEATEENLDQSLMKFLKENFKVEVKDKQKANELAAGIDRFGEAYMRSNKCTVM